jgi:hypothetical protein
MSLKLPARLSENDVNALGLLLPSGFALKAEALALFVTFRNPSATPLVTIEISPFHKKDFSGTLLATFVEDLARTMKLAHAELAASTDDVQNRILHLLHEPVHQPMTRHLAGHEFRVRVRTIHTTKLEDWFP